METRESTFIYSLLLRGSWWIGIQLSSLREEFLSMRSSLGSQQRNRILTRDRLRSWVLSVPATCLLFNSDEWCISLTPVSSTAILALRDGLWRVWSFFTSKAHLFPPNLFEDELRWMKDPTRDKNVSLKSHHYPRRYHTSLPSSRPSSLLCHCFSHVPCFVTPLWYSNEVLKEKYS